MIRRSCLGCGRLIASGSRCPRCQLPPNPTTASRTPAERRRRAVAVAQWRKLYGDWCPGWGDRPPHPATDLTADHIEAVGAGGDPAGPLRVLCRRCNSARGARP
jgi:5-methylcytosine-specific restriction protein A